jgi:transcriptional regulator with XRE-family HTH domain
VDNIGVATQDRLVRCLAQAIRERRESLGASATQEEIAHRAHVSVRHLQKIEHGLGVPKLDTLLAVSKALKTNLQSLLDRADELLPKRER